MTPKELEERLGYRFSEPDLLVQAVTHPSAVKEGRSPGPDNQRLEFLGDAVLHLVAAHLLIERFTEADEGDLTLLRSSMVNDESLSEAAVQTGIEQAILAGPSMAKAEPVALRNAAADALEAIVGAVYLDGGLEGARGLVERLLGAPSALAQPRKGSKTVLQETLQARFDGDVPRYAVVETGPGGAERFAATVFHGERALGEGTGRTKKQAEEAAAAAALKGLGRE